MLKTVTALWAARLAAGAESLACRLGHAGELEQFALLQARVGRDVSGTADGVVVTLCQ